MTGHTLFRATLGVVILVGLATCIAIASDTVPTEIEQPGTQPGEITAFATNCDSCHAGTDNPNDEPSRGWYGSMMSNAARDPLFWATVAIAEQTFIPNADPNARGGAGDLCLRCHMPNGWSQNRSTPTDGSSMTGTDERGVECEFCHLLVDPDPDNTLTGTDPVQNAPFEAYDPTTHEGYYGSGQFVINGNGTRLGPYAEGDEQANHAAMGSPFMRDSNMCGTCHDVSNPAVGDLAHNNGHMVPLADGTYSGVLGSPVEGKAAFNNPPYAYGVVERTFSEHMSSAFPTYRVDNYGSLPADLQDGILAFAYNQAYDGNRGTADYEDGAPRYFTCQTCHNSAATGEGCNKNNMPIRTDLPRHDMTGGGYWMPDVIEYQYDKGTLRFGTLTTSQRADMAYGKQRATARLQESAGLSASQPGNDLVVRIANLTGHKLISGYPEGRRMWINIRWLDGGGGLVAENGAYGNIGRTVQDLDGVTHQVQSLIDLDDSVVFHAEMGLDQEWANQLLSLGYDPNLALTYDRMTDAADHTLGELGAEDPGHTEHSFHFVLNNIMIHDNRIPPYGMAYDEGLKRSIIPVPADQYGNPGPGGTFDYWGEYPFTVPAGAVTAEVNLYYQQTSWEYVQFLWLANDGLNASLGSEGVNMLDAYLNTGQNAPLLMETTTVAVTPGTTAVPGQADQMTASYDGGTGQVDVSYVPSCDATSHTIYWGDLVSVGSYAYIGAECNVGVSGSASFDPGTGSVYFLITGNNASDEGSYGEDSTDVERPEDIGTIGCDYDQNLGGVVCE